MCERDEGLEQLRRFEHHSQGLGAVSEAVAEQVLDLGHTPPQRVALAEQSFEQPPVPTAGEPGTVLGGEELVTQFVEVAGIPLR